MTRDPFSARPLVWLGGVAALSVAALLIGWGAGTTISGAVIASGRIEIDVNRQVVQSDRGGIVTNIQVRDGVAVAQGDLLVQLDASDARSELAVVVTQLDELAARKSRLLAERDDLPTMVGPTAASRSRSSAQQLAGQLRLFEARRDRHVSEKMIARRQIAEIGSRLAGLEAQKSALEDQAALVKQEEDVQSQLLERGLTEASRSLAVRREHARLRGETARLGAEISASRARIASIEAEIAQLDRMRHEAAIADLRDLEFRALELSEKSANLQNAIERSSVRSPVSGVIHETKIHSLGAFVQPGDVLMYVVPNDRPLLASVRVDAAQIDQVFEGQEARLRLAAMDPRKAPDIDGRVTYVSADSIQNRETLSEYYLVRIEPAGEPGDWPDNGTLLPGMRVDAFIATGRQAPIEYLTRPLTDYFGRAFRDG